MMEVVDPVAGGTFFLGEVLVTSCRVEIRGTVGQAVVLGDEPERARAAAILDAAIQQVEAIPSAVVETLLHLEADIEETHRTEWALVERTRVQFESMENTDAGPARPRLR
jgi:alpha-D-ribose 1-methylphosphonate 5-triphosphate synthase subunit PhnG